MAIDNIQDGSLGSVVRGILNRVINWINGRPKVYVALISQSGTNPPTVDIIENTIGNIVWTYGNTGSYIGTLAGVFIIDKTLVFLGHNPGSICINGGQIGDINTIYISTIDLTTDTQSDSLLYKTSLRIEIYP